MHSETEFLFWEKIVPLWPIIKNMGKRVKNQNHTCTIHRNTTNSSIPLGSNIQFSTNTVKEQVIIKKTCNNEQIEFLCV
jgi:hypothetical protein